LVLGNQRGRIKIDVFTSDGHYWGFLQVCLQTSNFPKRCINWVNTFISSLIGLKKTTSSLHTWKYVALQKPPSRCWIKPPFVAHWSKRCNGSKARMNNSRERGPLALSLCYGGCCLKYWYMIKIQKKCNFKVCPCKISMQNCISYFPIISKFHRSWDHSYTTIKFHMWEHL
jgi:hypothetical protein